jgi:hypothetical protein
MVALPSVARRLQLTPGVRQKKMKSYIAFAVFTLVAVVLQAQSPDCVGDHHEGCPVLVISESSQPDPGCKGHQEISHGNVMWQFDAVLGAGSGPSFRPITSATVVRECLNEAGKVKRRCPVPLELGVDGSFTLELWRKSVDEAICRNDVMTSRQYEEHVQLRFKARGCDDLVVSTLWPSPTAPLVMVCGGQK